MNRGDIVPGKILPFDWTSVCVVENWRMDKTLDFILCMCLVFGSHLCVEAETGE